MKLSILLPTHNRADVLPFAIESVLAQTFADFELLICGDGCTDASAEVAMRYASADPRVRWFDLPKAPGFGYANRNHVLREARGDLIGFVAHDDIITRDHCALLVEAMEDPAVHLAYTEAVWVGRDGTMVPAVYHLEDKTMCEEYLARRWNRLPATCFMHRRVAFGAVGFWDENLLRGGDMDFWGRIIRSYGKEATRSVTVMTSLHFRAHWRLNELAPDTEPLWQQLHQEPGRLPEVMHWPVPSGMVEQEAFWRRLQAEPEIVPRVRDACRHALATYAWDLEHHLSVQRGLPYLADLKLAEQRLQNQALELNAALLHARSLEARVQELEGQKKTLKERRVAREAEFKELKQERQRLKKELSKAKKKPRWWRRIFE